MGCLRVLQNSSLWQNQEKVADISSSTNRISFINRFCTHSNITRLKEKLRGASMLPQVWHFPKHHHHHHQLSQDHINRIFLNLIRSMVALCLLQPWQGEYDHERDEGGDVEDGGGYDEDVDCDDIDDVDDSHNNSDIAACGQTNLRRLARGCWLWTRWRTPSRYHKTY